MVTPDCGMMYLQFKEYVFMVVTLCSSEKARLFGGIYLWYLQGQQENQAIPREAGD
jgi:hypothetical protein